jgi:anti-sigma factor RsiW
MSTTNPITDEDLVAYLDGALDPTRSKEIDAAVERDECLAARLAALDFDKEAVLASLEAIAAAAPIELLREHIRAQTAKPHSPSDARWQWFKIAAALLLGIGIGWGAGRPDRHDSSNDWRGAVADYQKLYTTATLSQIASDVLIERDEVAAVAGKLGLAIKLEELQIANLSFKRAQLLEFDGRLLAQFAYLDPDGIPLSFCVTRSNVPARPVRSGRLRGLSAASWDKNGYSFVLIGAGSAEALRQAAVALSEAI